MNAITIDPSRLRHQLHGQWSAVAPAWGEHADFVDARGAGVTGRLLELAELSPGERVLELACGAGGLGLAAAERVGPGGEAVLSDVAPEMLVAARARIAARGIANATTLRLDLEQIDQPDAAYDAVVCREGLMFALDPAAAAAEIARVLRPGGRVAMAVWGPREQNPWLGIVLDAVAAQTGAPVPPPGVPGPFALDDAGRLAALFTAAGLDEVAVEQLAVPLRAPSFDAWWARTTALAGPLSQMLATLPAGARAALRARAERSSARYRDGEALAFPGSTLIAGARKG
jgi:enediyne biosynthesis protein CalE5